MPNAPRSFQTDTPKANHAAREGDGIGELEAMQDPGGAADAADIPEEEDFADRSRPGDRNEADWAHGPKTRARSKEIINGRLT
ncbi:MAG: hypothetical protein IT546_13665 [Caulobacteraceae bacterium]|nr:hypothetical protein [Caulobacteraceae bacterium]